MVTSMAVASKRLPRVREVDSSTRFFMCEECLRTEEAIEEAIFFGVEQSFTSIDMHAIRGYFRQRIWK